MKTFRIIGIALLAIAMSVNFAACNNGEEEELSKNDDNTVSEQKKLVEIKESYVDRNSYTYNFNYDSQDRLISITSTTGSFSETSYYTWGNNIIVEQDGDNTTTYNLDKNLVKTIRYSDDELISLSYNSSNQLITFLGTNSYNNDTWTENYNWNKERLISYDDNEVEFSYSGKTCKGYFPLYFQESSYLEAHELFLAHPELAGIRSSQIPDKKIWREIVDDNLIDEIVVEYSYTLDKDGYLERCTELSIDYNSSSEATIIKTCIYTFTWE